MLDIASGPSSPLRKLLVAVGKNTFLSYVSTTEPPQNTTKGVGEAAAVLSATASAKKDRLEQLMRVADKVKGGSDKKRDAVYRVDSHFSELNAFIQTQDGSPAPLDELIADLYQAYNYLVETQTSGSSLDAAKRTASGSGMNPLKTLQQKARKYPNPVNNWVIALTRQGWNMVVGGTRSELSGMMGQEILPLCQRGIQGRFPFSKQTQKEVTLLDFTRFFGPGQLMESFFREHIQPFTDTTQSPWRWKSTNGHPVGISNRILLQFENIARIRRIFFSGGESGPMVGFSLKPLYLDNASRRFLLDINGQSVTYRHGPTRQFNLTWPSPNDTTGQSSIMFEDTNGKNFTKIEEGVWGWFKLLKNAEVKRNGQADRYLVTFSLKGHQIELQLRANSINNPFMMKELEAFQCPKL